jgi:Ran-binding protein 9/10
VGFLVSASALTPAQERPATAMELDGSTYSLHRSVGSAGAEEDDIELRTRIVNAVIMGDIDAALSETRSHHPTVLEREEGLMLFKLRCRKFVELILEAAELKKRMGAIGGVGEVLREEEEEREEEDDGLADMDIDDDASAAVNGFGNGVYHIIQKPQPTSMAIKYETALSNAISYGQTLQADYISDTRAEVQLLFKKTFGIVAYEDPLAAGQEVQEVVGVAARVKLANELNQAILSALLILFFVSAQDH